MSDEARALVDAARAATLPLGAFVAGLVAGVPALQHGASPATYASALVASNAALCTLSRDLRDLGRLLRQGSVRAAQEYWSTLDSLDVAVRNHLALACDVLAQLQPTRRSPANLATKSAKEAP